MSRALISSGLGSLSGLASHAATEMILPEPNEEKKRRQRKKAVLQSALGGLGFSLANSAYNNYYKTANSSFKGVTMTARAYILSTLIKKALEECGCSSEDKCDKCGKEECTCKKASDKPGLWANIRAKRKRGESPAKPGDKDYPDSKNWNKLTKESATPPTLAELALPPVLGPIGGAGVGAAIGLGGDQILNLLRPTEDKEKRKQQRRNSLLLGAGVGGGIGLSRGLKSSVNSVNNFAKQLNNEKRLEFLQQRLLQKQSSIAQLAKEAAGRCWEGYKPVKGKKAYSDDSCEPVGSKEKKAEGAWTRSEGKSESGGLNAKGRASLKAQGHDIKPPVTESKPTGERAARRKSFCARMGGMKSKLTSSETANDPDSRINKALRKWNC